MRELLDKYLKPVVQTWYHLHSHIQLSLYLSSNPSCSILEKIFIIGAFFSSTLNFFRDWAKFDTFLKLWISICYISCTKFPDWIWDKIMSKITGLNFRLINCWFYFSSKSILINRFNKIFNNIHCFFIFEVS